MTLIEMVRKARAIGHRWVATDKNGEVYSFNDKPSIGVTIFISQGKVLRGGEYLGNYNLTCNWKDSLIDITKLRGIK